MTQKTVLGIFLTVFVDIADSTEILKAVKLLLDNPVFNGYTFYNGTNDPVFRVSREYETMDEAKLLAHQPIFHKKKAAEVERKEKAELDKVSKRAV